MAASCPRRAARLARTLGLDRNPLRRATDRALAWIRLWMVTAFLTGGSLAVIGAGQWMHHAAVSEARVQAADSHSTRAVLLEPAPVTMAMPRLDGQSAALARWEGSGGVPRTGEVLARSGLPAGSLVTVWLDASGQPTQPPLQRGQITERTLEAATAAAVVLALSLLTTLWLAQRIADKRRLAAWDTAWSMVGPQWTGRR